VLPGLILAAASNPRRPAGSPILLACSGGLDSQVLMHAAASVLPRQSFVVAHVQHGLQAQAGQWLALCESGAAALGLPFIAHHLPPLPARPPGGIEAWARGQRYRALAWMAEQAGATVVLTAHHANDQWETHRLRRLRGAGALGLGAMRGESRLPLAPERLLLRPFLGLDRREILAYAHAQGLDWVEDPSNQDPRYARNRVRRLLAETLSQDPGSLQAGLAEIDEFQRRADTARRQARQDLATCSLFLASRKQHPAIGGPLGEDAGPRVCLSRASLARLPEERAAEALRLWLEDLGCRMPSRSQLSQMLRQLRDACSTHARMRHDDRWLLRYRDCIDAAAALPQPLVPVWFRWSGQPHIDIGGQRFLFLPGAGEGIDAAWLAGTDLLMDQARGSDRLQLAPKGHLRTWKNLSQEHGIPPWIRAALPVLRHAGGIVHAAPFGFNRRAGGGESTADSPRVRIEWVAPACVARWL